MARRGWLGTTVRSLARSPGFSVPAFVLLTLGIGTNVAIFTVVDGVLLEPLPLPDSDRLVTLCERHPSLGEWCGGSVPNVHDLGVDARNVHASGSARWWPFTLVDADGVTSIDAAIATPGFFRALGVRPAEGRLFADDEVGPDADDVVVLSHGLWTRRYGADPDVLGRSLTLDGEPVVIVGVLPPDFEFPGLEGSALWRPAHVNVGDDEARAWRGFLTVARLSPDGSLRGARSELPALYRRMGDHHAAVTDEWRLEVMSLRERVVGDVAPVLVAFLGAVILLLLIACANVANLVLARSTRRAEEFAVRIALGGRHRHLVEALVSEGLVLAVAAGSAGLALAWWGSRMFVAMAPPELPRLDNVGVDLTVAGFAVLLAVATVALVALLPVLRLRDLDVGARLTSSRGGTEDRRGRRLRQGLVVAELTLSLVLLFWSGLFARSLMGYLSWDPGFELENLLVASVILSPAEHPSHDQRMAFYRAVDDELESLPGVRSVGASTVVPLRGGREARAVRYEGGPALTDEALPVARYHSVDPGYFEALGLPVLQGRTIRDDDGSDAARVAVVNQALARSFWPGLDPLGRWVEFDFGAGPDRFRVVGVVADIQPLTPGRSPEPAVYWSDRQVTRGSMIFVIRTEPGRDALARAVHRRLRTLDPTASVGAVTSMESLLAEPLARPRFDFTLVAVFAVVAALLAGIGVYSVLSYLVAQRARAIGIRMALGSSGLRVVRGVAAEAARLAAVGVALGSAVCLASSPLLSGMIHGVSPSDGRTLAWSAVGLVMLALVACVLPAWRASHVDPSRLLREE